MSNFPLKEAAYALKSYYADAEETEKIILNCAFVAAAADAVGGAVPVLAIPATVISCVGAVWAMYVQICNKLGISIKKNVLKFFARAMLTNIVINLGGALAVVIASMFVPVTSILASAIVTFLAVYLAGLMFLHLILRLAGKSNDLHAFSDLSESEMKKEARNTKVSKEELEAAKQAYEERRENS